MFFYCRFGCPKRYNCRPKRYNCPRLHIALTLIHYFCLREVCNCVINISSAKSI